MDREWKKVIKREKEKKRERKREWQKEIKREKR